jgi:hypothetical protein
MGTTLFCPLDWGLGHATRIIPLICQRLDAGDKVIIAGYGRSLDLLKLEFPDLQFVYFPGFNVCYHQNIPLALGLFFQLPLFLWHKNREFLRLQNIIDEHHPTLIISDNRYGIYSRKVKSVIITHQLRPYIPGFFHFFEPVVQQILKKWISKFDECWIPDFDSANSLAGQLSHVSHTPAHYKYIGCLSRFLPSQSPSRRGDFILAIVSGPEPARSQFYNLLRWQLKESGQMAILIGGQPNVTTKYKRDGNLLEINHLSSFRLNFLMNRCKFVICRSGYSSLMDLVATHTPALLVATPGQTEQQYLSKYLMGQNRFFAVSQDELCIPVHINQALDFYREKN